MNGRRPAGLLLFHGYDHAIAESVAHSQHQLVVAGSQARQLNIRLSKSRKARGKARIEYLRCLAAYGGGTHSDGIVGAGGGQPGDTGRVVSPCPVEYTMITEPAGAGLVGEFNE